MALYISRIEREKRKAEEEIAAEKDRMDVVLSNLETGLALINPDMTICLGQRQDPRDVSRPGTSRPALL